MTHCTEALRLQALAADAAQLLVAQAHQHVSLERELVQLGALVKVLALLDKVHQAEDILESYEPGHHR